MPAPFKPPVRARAADAGFTLLEVLVALVVLGLVVVGLSQGVSFGLHAWNDQARIIAAATDTAAAEQVLRRMVAEMDPGTATTNPNFAGGPNRLAFTTTLGQTGMAQAVTPLGTTEADVALFTQNGALMMGWAPTLRGTRLAPPPPPAATVLLPGVERVDFAYWQPSAGAWLPRWAEPALPALVRIRLVFAPSTRRRWPDIIAPVMRVKPSD